VGRAFAVAKRVRTETEVGRSSVSMVHAAVELTTRVFDTLAGKQVVVIGAGEMGRLAAERLLAHKVAALHVVNRTLANAEALVQRLGGGAPLRAIPLEALGPELEWADVVLSAAAAERPLVTRELMKAHLKARRFRPLLLVDLAVPRSIDPAVSSLENVYTKDVDDVGRLVAQNEVRRSEEALRAEEIVAAEVARFARVLRGRSAVPVLHALREHGAAVADEEARRTLSRIGSSLDEQQRESVVAMAHAIVNKLLHEPTAKLRAAAEAGQATVLADAAGELFGLTTAEATKGQLEFPAAEKEKKA
jgi:glutamyl-tRNA reductase